MKFIYHVHTAFSRPQNLAKFLPMIEAAKVVWHPIYEATEKPDLPEADWIKPMVCDKCATGWFPGSWKTNWFFDHAEIDDNARYLSLNDDDFYEPGFFKKLDQHDHEVMLCSMKRGVNPTLIACPENVRGGMIGGEQIILSGRIQKQFRWGKAYAGDWDFIEAVTAKHPPHFAPEAYVWFNYLKPGDWP